MIEAASPGRITVLGPQRRPSLRKVVDAMGLHGPFAVITAGWQERERDDAELASYLPGETVNLSLWHRMQQALEDDAELAAAWRTRRERIASQQELYLIGVNHTMDALEEIRSRTEHHPQAIAEAAADAETVLAGLDRRHLERVRAMNSDFYEWLAPHARQSVARHRAEVADLLDRSAAVVISGGHVAELLAALHLFNVAPVGLDRLPIIAWSAGAMVLTPTVVLFNDNAARQPAWAEVYDSGLGILRDVVLLPSAHRRLREHDRARMGTFARRFAPASCVLLDPGANINLDPGGPLPDAAPVLGLDGSVTTVGGRDGA